MKKNEKISAWYSWPVIIITLCVFWPVGLFLLIKRLSLDKKASLVAGKTVGIIGAVSYAIAILGFIACLSEGMTSEDVGCILFFAVAGFALRRVAKKTKKEAEDVKQYLSVIVNGHVRQLDSIAAATGKSYDVVRANIQKMINKGYLKNAFINESTRELVLPDLAPATPVAPVVPVATNTEYIPEQAPAAKAPAQPVGRMVSCPCCGANNTIYGASGECEYCGSPLE